MGAEDTKTTATRSTAALTPTGSRIARIAEILGCSAEAFLDGGETQATEPASDAREMAELVRLWSALRDPALRRDILAQLREAVARQTGV